jgi:hypothetical protein
MTQYAITYLVQESQIDLQAWVQELQKDLVQEY